LLTHTPSFYKRVAGTAPSDAIDRGVFDQILELDEDGELFSKDMVDAYFEQAEKTFNDMDIALCAFAAPSASSS
jgi:osomolarity two-component system phosphorelay intermediate protein YPD1